MVRGPGSMLPGGVRVAEARPKWSVRSLGDGAFELRRGVDLAWTSSTGPWCLLRYATAPTVTKIETTSLPPSLLAGSDAWRAHVLHPGDGITHDTSQACAVLLTGSPDGAAQAAIVSTAGALLVVALPVARLLAAWTSHVGSGRQLERDADLTDESAPTYKKNLRKALQSALTELVVETVSGARRRRRAVFEGPATLSSSPARLARAEDVSGPPPVTTIGRSDNAAFFPLVRQAMEEVPAHEPIRVDGWMLGGGVLLALRDRGLLPDPRVVARVILPDPCCEEMTTRRQLGTIAGVSADLGAALTRHAKVVDLARSHRDAGGTMDLRWESAAPRYFYLRIGDHVWTHPYLSGRIGPDTTAFGGPASNPALRELSEEFDAAWAATAPSPEDDLRALGGSPIRFDAPRLPVQWVSIDIDGLVSTHRNPHPSEASEAAMLANYLRALGTKRVDVVGCTRRSRTFVEGLAHTTFAGCFRHLVCEDGHVVTRDWNPREPSSGNSWFDPAASEQVLEALRRVAEDLRRLPGVVVESGRELSLSVWVRRALSPDVERIVRAYPELSGNASTRRAHGLDFDVGIAGVTRATALAHLEAPREATLHIGCDARDRPAWSYAAWSGFGMGGHEKPGDQELLDWFRAQAGEANDDRTPWRVARSPVYARAVYDLLQDFLGMNIVLGS